MKASPFLSGSWDSLMAPLFTPVRSVYLPPHTHTHTTAPPHSSIQSEETASQWPEGRKGAVSDHIITQRETHSARLLYGRCRRCWVPFGRSGAGERADRQSFWAE